MTVSLEPAHLPKCPLDKKAYDRLYAFNHNLDNQMSEAGDWQEIRIKPGLSEDDVYRLLPSASDYEFSGYLTRTRIRYLKGDAFSAGMMMAKACTYHSHPTRHPYLADIPSLKDIYSFLNYRHLRTITVGATKIWVWDKTKSTLETVRKLSSWMNKNHFRVVTILIKKDFHNWKKLYPHVVLRDLGWVWPETLDDMLENWPRIMREMFKIKVRVFPRNPSGKGS